MDSHPPALGRSRGGRLSARHPASVASSELVTQSDRGRLAAPSAASLAETTTETLYRPVCDALQQVEHRLQQELHSDDLRLAPLLRHGVLLGGKRLRPALVLLAAAATGQLSDDHVVLGTVIEMVHTATLIHDDVLDGATHRRHQMTVNARWDGQTSILLGDYLFAQSFQLAATLGSTEACRWIGDASRKVCEGELRQVFSRGDVTLDENAYLEMVRGKTAELCRVACRLGAAHGGASEATIAVMDRYGESLGIAFQIADDYLDLWGDDRHVGKTLGTDLQQAKLTLPLIRLLDLASPQLRAAVHRILAGPPQGRFEAVMPLLESSDARQYTLRRARQYVQQAVDCVTPLADSDAKSSLLQIARFAVDRQV